MAIVKIKKSNGGFSFERDGVLTSYIKRRATIALSGNEVSISVDGQDLKVRASESLEINDEPFSGTAAAIRTKIRDEVLNAAPGTLTNPYNLSAVEETDGTTPDIRLRFMPAPSELTGNLSFFGNGSSSMGGTGASVPANKYMELIKADLDVTVPTVNMLNLGISGWHIRLWYPNPYIGIYYHIFSGIEMLWTGGVKKYPHFLLLQDASNFVQEGLTNAEELTHIQAYIAIARKRGIHVYLLSPQPRTAYTSVQRQQLADMHQLLVDNYVTVKVPGVTYVDVFTEFKNGPTDYTIKSDYIVASESPNNIHINDAGHSLVRTKAMAAINAVHTLDSLIDHHEIQVSDTLNGTYTNFNNAIPAGTGTIRANISNLTKFFRHRTVYTNGTQTAWSTPVQPLTLASNDTPIVFAGANQVVTLPDTDVALSGFGTYDPDNGRPTYLWTKQSGPGTPTITSPNERDTTVTGLQEGSYTFRLTSTDAKGASAFDDVVVQVNSATLSAKVHTPITTGTQLYGKNIKLWEFKPEGYDQALDDTLPAIVFLHGAGEISDNINEMLEAGIPKYINDGATMKFVNPNGGATEGFVVVSVQLPAGRAGWTNDYIDFAYNYAVGMAKVNPARIHLTGLSAGSAGIQTWATTSKANADKLATASAAAMVSQTINDTCSTVVASNLPMWVVTDAADWAYSGPQALDAFVNAVNACDPDPVPAIKWQKYATNPADPHNSWDRFYEFGHVYNSPENVFEWMLKYTNQRGSSNQSPNANAGTDSTITLPTSQATLVGTGSTDDVGIVTYAWSKISGPSTFTITSPNAATTTVTGLVEGTYVFRLTVTDAGGLTDTDDVQVTVNPASSGVTGRVLIDLATGAVGGGYTVASPDEWGKRWNLAPGPFAAGYQVTNLINTENVNTGLTFEWTNQTWGGTGSPGINNAGISVNVNNEYPFNATKDSALLDSGEINSTGGSVAPFKTGLITFYNLDATRTYAIKLWASRNASGPRAIEFKKSTGNWATSADVKSYDAASSDAAPPPYDNGNQTVTFTGVTTAAIDTRIKAGNSVGFAYVGIIDITIT